MDHTRTLFRERVKLLGGAEKVAGQLGVTRAYVDMLATVGGSKLPSLQLARRIEDLLGIPMRAWSDTAPGADAKVA